MYHHKYGMCHVSLIKTCISIYLSSMACIIKAKHHHKQNINAKHQPTGTQKFLRGNPVTGEKTTEASLNFTSLTARGGNNPLQFTLPVYCWKENTTPFYTITFSAATGRGYNPYTPTM